MYKVDKGAEHLIRLGLTFKDNSYWICKGISEKCKKYIAECMKDRGISSKNSDYKDDKIKPGDGETELIDVLKDIGNKTRKEGEEQKDTIKRVYCNSEGGWPITEVTDTMAQVMNCFKFCGDEEEKTYYRITEIASRAKAACNMIYSNRDRIGKNILFIGNDFGIVSSFLAREFPDSEITVFCEIANSLKVESIDVSKGIKEELKLDNINFLFDMLSHLVQCLNERTIPMSCEGWLGAFDAIITFRDITPSKYLVVNDTSWVRYSMKEMVNHMMDEFYLYVNACNHLLSTDGIVIQTEDFDFFTGTAWYFTMLGCKFGEIFHHDIICNDICCEKTKPLALDRPFLGFIFERQETDFDCNEFFDDWLETHIHNIKSECTLKEKEGLVYRLWAWCAMKYKTSRIDMEESMNSIETILTDINAELMAEYYNFNEKSSILKVHKCMDSAEISLIRCGWIEINNKRKYAIHIRWLWEDSFTSFLIMCSHEYANCFFEKMADDRLERYAANEDVIIKDIRGKFDDNYRYGLY